MEVSSFFPPCGFWGATGHQTWQQAPLPTEHPKSSEVLTGFFEPSEGVLRLRVLHVSLYEGVGAVPDTAPHSSNPAWFRSWDVS